MESSSWREFPIQQLPDYPNKEELEFSYNELQTLPPWLPHGKLNL